jgi:aldehyde:ferredoxin oxidoreductase
MLFDELTPGTDPLSPENKLAFLTGPVTATPFPTSTRHEVCTISPLTGLWLDSSSAGTWAVPFKRSGYDGLIVEGAADRPVYLSMRDGAVSIHEASHLWGQDALHVQDSIREDLGDGRASVACIGPAGEKRALLAAIINDEGRAAGRGGAGAVMGAKNLKAIAVQGATEVRVADREGLGRFIRTVEEGFAQHPLLQSFKQYGTVGGMDVLFEIGDIPIQNWRRGEWTAEQMHGLGGDRIAKTILRPHSACRGCTIKCSRWVEIEAGPYKMTGPGPEYETAAALGSLCLNDNLEALCFANDLCNRYGLDTMSAGVAIAFAMEAFERGLLTVQDADGLDLSWGNAETIIGLIRQMGESRGLGALLNRGVKRAAAQIGRGAERFAVHVRGLEVPMHDPRAFFSMAVNYATSPRGACHLHGQPLSFESGATMPEAGIAEPQDRFALRGKGLAAKVAQDMASVYNSMIVCFFSASALQPSQIGELLTLVTGEEYDGQRVLLTGERVVNLQRLFNIRMGMDPGGDGLPPRLLEPTPDGPIAGKVPNINDQLKEYYQVRGWSERGVPSAEKLESLGLLELAADVPGISTR